MEKTLWLFLGVTKLLSAQQAVVIVPVADLLLQPMFRSMQQDVVHNVVDEYNKIPASWNSLVEKYACPRVHQLLFNEIVSIIEENDYEYCVDISQSFFQNLSDEEPQTYYWTLKNNLLPLDLLSEEQQQKLPKPVDFRNPCSLHDPNIITLVYPFADTTGLTFSAGTRFVIDSCFGDIIHVNFYNPAKNYIDVLSIPSNLCINSTNYPTQAMKRKAFVTLLRTWVRNYKIPFVWGGCSFLSCSETILESYIPYSGFDVSGLILRSMHIVGLPYFYKNSMTAARYLKPLDEQDEIQEGDLIVVPKGLFVLTNAKLGLVTACMGTTVGYGTLIEIPLEKLFFGVHSFADLHEAYLKKKSLKTLKADGTTSRIINQWFIAQLPT